MRVSVVLPAFNEEKLLPAAIAAVKAAASAFTARGWEWECVVCDNNSTDGTSAVARAAGATVVFEPVNQIGRARDAGARAATGEWLVFIDADSTPSAELFASIATRIAEGRALGGGSTVELEPGTPSLAAPLILPEETKARKSWSWRKVTFIVIILCYVFLE